MVCAFAVFSLAAPGCADELKLRDGTKITGTIVGYENDSFKVETSYGFALVKKEKVASITLSEPKAGNPKQAAKSAPPPGQPPQPTASSFPAPVVTSDPASAGASKPARALPAEPAIKEEVDKTTYINYTYGFKMYKPPRWNVIEGAHNTLPSAVVAMGTTDERTLLVVGREPLKGSLEAQSAATEKRLREIYENYRPLSEQRILVAGVPALQKRFRGTVGENDWSGVVISVGRGNEVFTILGMTYENSDLIQIQENVIARTIASLEFTKK